MKPDKATEDGRKDWYYWWPGGALAQSGKTCSTGVSAKNRLSPAQICERGERTPSKKNNWGNRRNEGAPFGSNRWNLQRGIGKTYKCTRDGGGHSLVSQRKRIPEHMWPNLGGRVVVGEGPGGGGINR